MKFTNYPKWIMAMFALMLTMMFAAHAAEPLTQKYHVQINPDYHLFQYDTIGNTHVLVYVQRAYNAKGEYVGWLTHQVAGPWGNSVDYLKDRNNINKAFMTEFKEAMRISTELEFVLAGVLESSYWVGTHINIAGDPIFPEWK